jgi:hypothetical protein
MPDVAFDAAPIGERDDVAGGLNPEQKRKDSRPR